LIGEPPEDLFFKAIRGLFLSTVGLLSQNLSAANVLLRAGR